jgi:chloramphenicol-sensitive protein RarD
MRGQLNNIRTLLTPRIIILYLAAGILLSINWLTYVWGVNAGFVIETSLGYFINPLVSVFLGVVILREKLRPMQWLPVGLAAIGVIYLTIQHGSLPWIALVLAFSFGTYGLLKKIGPLKSLPGLTIETAGVFIPALVFLIFSEFQQTGAFGHINTFTSFLLILSGLVTAIPLILFAIGAPIVPLSTIGILQYIAPTLQFLIGMFIYHEPFSYQQLIGFAIIWLALIIFSIEGLNARRQAIKIAHLAQI